MSRRKVCGSSVKQICFENDIVKPEFVKRIRVSKCRQTYLIWLPLQGRDALSKYAGGIFVAKARSNL